MADGLCTEGTVRSKMFIDDNNLLVDNKNNYISMDVSRLSETSDNCELVAEASCDSSKKIYNSSSFYIDSDSGQLCSKFTINNNNNNSSTSDSTNASNTNFSSTSSSVTDTKVEAISTTATVTGCAPIESIATSNSSSNVCDSPCSLADHEDCRKKRCTDRYDSSESSDSGVAQLSCTDCSACSSSSTASSDITDPGSPFSTGSSHGEDSTHAPSTNVSIKTTTSSGMPPQQSITPPPDSTPSPVKQPWPWDKSNTQQLPPMSSNLKRTTAIKNSHTNAKRLKSTLDKPTHQHNVVSSTSDGKNLPNPGTLITRKVSNIKTPTTLCHILPKPISLPIQTQSDNIIHSSNVISTSNISNNISIVTRSSDRPILKARTVSPQVESSNSGAQQVKITEYFKAQIKSPAMSKKESTTTSIKVDTNRNASCATAKTIKSDKFDVFKQTEIGDVGKYLNLFTSNINSPQLYFNGNCDKREFVQSKVDVRTLTLQNHLKAANLDTKFNMKVNRKILPKPAVNEKKINGTPNTPLTSSSKGIKPISEFNVSSTNKLNGSAKGKRNSTPITPIVSPVMIPSNVNTALPTVVTSKLNNLQMMRTSSLNPCSPFVKLHGTFIPFVKLNTVPMKVNGISSCTNTLKLTEMLKVDTATTTVPSIKPKSSVTTTDSSLKSQSSPQSVQKQLSSPKSAVLETLQKKTKIESTDSYDHCRNSQNNFLQVNTANYNLTPSLEPQKSPILSQPKIIRFPPQQLNRNLEDGRSESRDSGCCQWSECMSKFENCGALLEHLQIAHVISQATKEVFVCHWTGCKVYGRKSCSRSWLERHVLSHAGNKPYRCIVDGCGLRFSTQSALERHVNGHFNGTEGAPNNMQQRRSLENGSNKLLKRNGKKIRYRLQPWSARMFDFFDAGIMEGLQHRLINMTNIRTAGKLTECSGNTMTLKSQIIARRTQLDGSKSVLLRWHPENIVPDEWIKEAEAKLFKTIPIPGLKPSAIDVLHTTLFKINKDDTSSMGTSNKRRNRRKQISSSCMKKTINGVSPT